ncbi:hypothetical protein [Sediminicola luteus]|nr:hypothetical protein [Sediminicola luteus]
MPFLLSLKTISILMASDKKKKEYRKKTTKNPIQLLFTEASFL